ncbi:MAG TPA: ABC transporter transmembrane domain-containing protein, partial [Allocoleopsis sp.]
MNTKPMNTKHTTPRYTKQVQEGEVLLLDDPQQVWVVQSGSFALFASSIEDGKLQGMRRYLCTIEKGEGIFGFALPAVAKRCILAVPITDAQLQGYDRPQLENTTGRSLLTNWLQQLSSVFDSTGILLPPPEMVQQTPWQTHLTMLDNFQQQFLGCVEELEQQLHQATLQQFQERERLNRTAISEAIADFVSLVKPQREAGLVGEPLLIAAGAVGRAIGMQIKPPAASENMKRVKEPLEAIARASQMRLRKVQLRERWWRDDCGSLLGYLRSDNTPVALLINAKSRYEIYHPVTQQRIPLGERTAKLLAPTAYMFYTPFPNEKVNLPMLLQYSFRGRAPEVLSLVVLGLLIAFVGMAVPQAMGILIDTAIPDANRGLLLQLTLGLVAASFGAALFQLTQGINLGRLAIYSYANVQAAMWDRLLKLRIAFFREHSAGELLSRVNAIEQIRLKISADKLDVLSKSFFSLLNLGLLFVYSPPLASVATVVVLLTAIFTSIAGHFKRQKSSQQEEMEGIISGMTIQLVGGISKLRTTASEGRAFAFWSKRYREQLRLMRDSQAIEDTTAAFNLLQANLTPILIFWMTVSLVNQGQADGLSTGTFLAFNTAFATFMVGVTTLSNSLVDLLEIGVLWDYAKPIAEELPEVDLDKADP